MSEFRINIEEAFNPKPNETYIGLINIDRPPFHLVTIANLKQFSWEVEKSRIGESIDSLLRHLNKDGTRCVFLKISEDPSVYDHVEAAYRNSTNTQTCIDPINGFLNSLVKKRVKNPLTIFELMEFLNGQPNWTASFGLNLDSEEIKLEIYDRYAVNRHVRGLQQNSAA